MIYRFLIFFTLLASLLAGIATAIDVVLTMIR